MTTLESKLLEKQRTENWWRAYLALFNASVDSLADHLHAAVYKALDVLFAGVIIAFSAVIVLYVYSTGDTTMLAITLVGVGFVWYAVTDRFGWMAFGIIVWATTLVPIMFIATAMNLPPFYRFALILTQGIGIPLAVGIALYMARVIIYSIVMAFTDEQEPEEKPPTFAYELTAPIRVKLAGSKPSYVRWGLLLLLALACLGAGFTSVWFFRGFVPLMFISLVVGFGAGTMVLWAAADVLTELNKAAVLKRQQRPLDKLPSLEL